MSKRRIIPIGPYHPLQEEPEFFKLIVEGENVVDLEIEIGYNHRGIEKLSESKHWEEVAFLVERICGICSTSHPYAYVLAVEDLLGIKPTRRASFIRMIIAELERIHSHLLWLGLAGHFIGYNTVWMWAWRAREPILDLFELISGNRNSYAMMKVGGVRRDIKDEDFSTIKNVLKNLYPQLKLFLKAIDTDPVIHKRTKNVGVLTKEEAKNFCVVGPTARASGIDIDVRRDEGYSLYKDIEWDVIVREEGDVYAKIIVRVFEMFESIRIIEQSLDKMPKEPIEVEIREIPEGEGIGRVEAPRGECFHYIRSDGSSHPIRHKVRAPSYMNVASNIASVPGYTISDAAITLASVDPCYCCTERAVALRKKDNKKIFTGEDLIRLSQEKTKKIREEQKKDGDKQSFSI